MKSARFEAGWDKHSEYPSHWPFSFEFEAAIVKRRDDSGCFISPIEITGFNWEFCMFWRSCSRWAESDGIRFRLPGWKAAFVWFPLHMPG